MAAGASKSSTGGGHVSRPPRTPELVRRPVVGSMLTYRLTVENARIAADRMVKQTNAFKHSIGAPNGVTPQSGDVLPFTATFVEEDRVRGVVQLDGDGTLWVTAHGEGSDRGQWRWPEAELSESAED